MALLEKYNEALLELRFRLSRTSNMPLNTLQDVQTKFEDILTDEDLVKQYGEELLELRRSSFAVNEHLADARILTDLNQLTMIVRFASNDVRMAIDYLLFVLMKEKGIQD